MLRLAHRLIRLPTLQCINRTSFCIRLQSGLTDSFKTDVQWKKKLNSGTFDVTNQKELNKTFIQLISAGNFTQFKSVLEASVLKMNSVNVATVLFNFAKYRHKNMHKSLSKEASSLVDMYLDRHHLKQLIDVLRRDKQMNNQRGGTLISGQLIGNLLYSFYGTGGAAGRVQPSALSIELLDVICENYLSQFTGIMKPMEIANALYGLQNYHAVDIDNKLSSTNNSSRVMLEGNVISKVYRLLTPIIERSIRSPRSITHTATISDVASNVFGFQDIGLALYGLKSNILMNEHQGSKELQHLLKVLADKIHGGVVITSAQSLSSALYGLRFMSSDVTAVRSILAALESRLAIPAITTPNLNIATVNRPSGSTSVSSDDGSTRNTHNDVTPTAGPTAASTATIHHEDGLLFRAQNVSNSLYGLQNMSSSHSEVRLIVQRLAQIIKYNVSVHKLGQPGNQFIAQHVGNSLYGLQNMSTEHAETLELLRALTPLLPLTEDEDAILPRNVDNALFGMKNMSARHKEVRKILALLDIKIQSCSEQWSSEGIARAMYGLQNMSSHYAEVRDIVATLTLELSTCLEMSTGEQISSQSICNMLAGLQYMSSEHKETKDFLAALLRVCGYSVRGNHQSDVSMEALYRQMDEQQDVRSGNSVNITATAGASNHTHTKKSFPLPVVAPITSQNVGLALYGIQRMTCIDNSEVKHLLQYLAHWIQTGHTSVQANQSNSNHSGLQYIDGQAISKAIFGLQRMPSDIDEVQQLLNVLAEKIQCPSSLNNTSQIHPSSTASGYYLSELDVGRWLYGLQNMTNADEAVVQLCTAVLTRISPVAMTGSGFMMTAPTIASGFYGCRNITLYHQSCRQIAQLLSTQLTQLLIREQQIPLNCISNIIYGMQSFIRLPERDLLTDQEWADITDTGVNMLTAVNSMMSSGVHLGNTLSLMQTGKCLNGLLELNDELLQRQPCVGIFTPIVAAAKIHTSAICQHFKTVGRNETVLVNSGQIAAFYQSLALIVHAQSHLMCLDPHIKQQLLLCYVQLHSVLHSWDEVNQREVNILDINSCKGSGGLNDSLELATSSSSSTTGDVTDSTTTSGAAAAPQSTLTTGLTGNNPRNHTGASAVASSSGTGSSAFERAWVVAAKRLLQSYPDILVESHTWLNGFEADIVITIPANHTVSPSTATTDQDHNISADAHSSVSSSSHDRSNTHGNEVIVINIELDGPHHAHYPSKQRYTFLRDDYLTQSTILPVANTSNTSERHVEVIRIPYYVNSKQHKVPLHIDHDMPSSSSSTSTTGKTTTGRVKSHKAKNHQNRKIEVDNWRQRALWEYLQPILHKYGPFDA